jgi:hypothetical protein
MGQSQENDISGFGKLFGGRIAEPNSMGRWMQGRGREHFRDLFAHKLARRYRRQFSVWMTQKQPDELFARVTGCAHDGYPGLLGFHRAQCVFRLATIATKDSVLNVGKTFGSRLSRRKGRSHIGKLSASLANKLSAPNCLR